MERWETYREAYNEDTEESAIHLQNQEASPFSIPTKNPTDFISLLTEFQVKGWIAIRL